MTDRPRPDDELWEHLHEEDAPSYEKHAWKRGKKAPRQRTAAPDKSASPNQGEAAESATAEVLAVGARRCTVLWQGREVACRLPSSLSVRQQADVAVGDRVRVETVRGTTWVREVSPRSTVLSRPDPRNPRLERVIAANIDRVVIVGAARRPGIRPGLLDRYLLAVEKGGARPVICINKVDLIPEGERAGDAELALLAPYRELGHDVVLCSAATGLGLAELRRLLAGSLCVFVGHSGVGKSSLVNALEPHLDLETAPVKESDGTGRHTTTRSNLFDLGDGIRVIDTPGIREFGLWDLDPAAVRASFEDFQPYAAACRFGDCTHTHEPRCGVLEAVERGDVAQARYDAYRRILESLES